MKFHIPFLLICFSPVLAFAHVTSSNSAGEGAPKPTSLVPTVSLKEGAPHWYTIPYDLKYDSKWGPLPKSVVKMNPADEIVVRGSGDFSRTNAYGVLFSTTTEWEEFISGHEVKVTVITRSSSREPMRFKIAYQTNDKGFSGWYYGVANKNNTALSFSYRVPPHSKLTKDFFVVIPEDQNTDLIISEAYLQFENE